MRPTHLLINQIQNHNLNIFKYLCVVVLVVVDSAGVTVDVLKYSLAVSVSQMPWNKDRLSSVKYLHTLFFYHIVDWNKFWRSILFFTILLVSQWLVSHNNHNFTSKFFIFSRFLNILWKPIEMKVRILFQTTFI